jgi:uracil-DNA glycosylase
METTKKLINIPNDWYSVLRKTIESPAFGTLGKHIAEERKKVNVFPEKENVFRAFQLTPLRKVSVVILGQDPYPNKVKGEIVANGLAFDTDVNDYIPPSLRQIYNAVKEDCYKEEFCFPSDMNLKSWAEQGVLLLNTALTVQEGNAASHATVWREFTYNVVKAIDDHCHGVFFCFWGKNAQQYKSLISESNIVLEAPHPVSASYSGTDWKCNHFSTINKHLLKYNNYEIQWIKHVQ